MEHSETAFDALSKSIASTSLGTADDCMADLKPVAPPTGANDDCCSAGALIRAVNLLG
jgi:hypothetical protein